MTAEAEAPDLSKDKRSKLPLIIGLVLALAGGGGGFFAVKSGLLGGGGAKDDAHAEEPADDPLDDRIAFVPLDPMIVSVAGSGGRNHLRFAAQLDVSPAHAAEVEAIRPRIVDVLNGYLRAVDLSEMDDPTTLTRLRGQMLRRVQVVAGQGRVNDLLIMEFVLN